MRRIQLYIDEHIDERLSVEASRSGRSKASLIRESIAARYGEAAGTATDLMTALVGSVDVDPDDPDDVDDVVYPR